MIKELDKQIRSVCSELFSEEVLPELTRPDEKFGDFSTNVALKLANKLKKNPKEVAEAIAAQLRKNDKLSEVSVAGPGFINLKLKDDILFDSTAASASPEQILRGQTIVTEYSDPNPFKVLHAGHLYTSIVGDAISNILEAAGAEVHRVNFGGDVGLHVAKAMWGILKQLDGENPDKLDKIVLPDPPDFRASWLSRCYVAGNLAYEDDPQAHGEIIVLNKRIYELHKQADHESPLAKIYWTCREWSYDYFKHFYEAIGVKPFRYYPESETAPIGIKKTEELLKKGILKESEGAVVFAGEQHGLHTRVFLTKDGLPTYETKDLGLIFAKYADYHFDRSVVITGNDIVEYMKVILKVVEQLEPELSEATTHLTHGLVKLPGAKKMSSRRGNVVEAIDIIESAAAMARSNHLFGSEDDEKEKRKIVYGAIKYAFLKNSLGGDIIFNAQESVAIEGNSGPYLQYALVRAKSILKKSGKTEKVMPDASELNPAERSLARKISIYPEVFSLALDELSPHHICTYLYELAQTFNRFYETNRVIDDPRSALRVELARRYVGVLGSGLMVLGIEIPEKM